MINYNYDVQTNFQTNEQLTQQCNTTLFTQATPLQRF